MTVIDQLVPDHIRTFEPYYPSLPDHVLMVRTPVSDTRIYRMLLAQGILIRTMTVFRFPNWIRVTLAREPEMKTFAKAFEAVLSKK